MKKLNWPFLIGAALVAWAVVEMSSCEGGWLFPSAGAGTADLTWVAPTKNCDGSNIGPLAKYTLLYGKQTVDLPLTPLAFTVNDLTPGRWWFSLSVVNTAGVRSEFTTAWKDIPASEFVVASPDVFALVKRVDRIVLSKVGTVPLGTVCNPNETVNGKYVVPKAAVSWSSLVRADVVVATCK
jgi:hypothetical protein